VARKGHRLPAEIFRIDSAPSRLMSLAKAPSQDLSLRKIRSRRPPSRERLIMAMQIPDSWLFKGPHRSRTQDSGHRRSNVCKRSHVGPMRRLGVGHAAAVWCCFIAKWESFKVCTQPPSGGRYGAKTCIVKGACNARGPLTKPGNKLQAKHAPQCRPVG